MFRRLSTRLTVLYAGLFGVALLFVSATVYVAVTRNAERMTRDELRASGTVFDRLWEVRARQLKDGASLLSRDFGFRAAIASRDAPTIRSALDNLRNRLGLDLAFILGPDGAPTTVSGAKFPIEATTAWRGLDGYRSTSGVARIGDTPYQVTATPILSPLLAGWVVFAAKLDDKEMRALERLSAIPLDADVFTREGGTWQGGRPAPAADGADLGAFIEQAIAANTTIPQTLRTGSSVSIALVKPLKSVGPGIDAALLIRYPLARALAPYRPMFVAIVLAGLSGMALLCFGSWILARGLTRPISALDDATHRLQRGETVALIAETNDEIGRLAHSFNAMAADISEREREITYLALHDSASALLNRTGFERALAALADTTTDDLVFVAAFGLDRFQHIRGAIGYSLAGRLIGEIGTRLADSLGELPVGRLASEVLVTAYTAPDAEAGRDRLDAMLAAVEAPFRLDGEAIDVSATAGLAIQGLHGETGTSLIERASIALDQARAAKRKIALFDEAAYGDPASNLSLISDLLAAIAADDLILHFQPKYDLRQARVTGAEALVRWRHPKRGMLYPDLFIGMAEETGHIGALTHWVLRQAIAAQATLRRAGFEIALSVNLSGRLLTDLDFARAAREAIAAARADICFEITETAVIENPELAAQVIDSFCAAGIGISIDDYGSGLSSLAYLRTIRAEELKIDKAFVLSLSESGADALLVKSTVDLAHGLGLKVTAEGVETAEALALLGAMGCDHAQGYFIARPLALDALIAFLQPPAQAAIPAAAPRAVPVLLERAVAAAV